ncbi:MAG: rubrerythrin family protein [Eubacterium sp.]|nr:rubrerythrin family protein [Eubacterium sp.]
MELAGSKTLENLKTAFTGEAEAVSKYTVYAEKAQQEGYQEISAMFSNTAKNEHAHAQLWLSLIDGGIPATDKALENSAGGENYKWSQLYAGFAATAREEGFDNIAVLFDMVGSIEQEHEKRFNMFRQQLLDGKVFTEDGECVWLCRNCGYIHTGKQPPKQCPVCRQPQGFFQRKSDSVLS